MKQWILILVLVAALLLLFAPVAVAQSLPPGDRSSVINLPVDVQVAGTTIPAGRYTLEYPAGWIARVGRPSVSMGFYSGPQMDLVPAKQGYLDGLIRKALPVPTFHLKTAVEARLLYDIPARERDVYRVRRDESVAVPMVKQGRLVAIALGERLLYVTEASAENLAALSLAPPKK